MEKTKAKKSDSGFRKQEAKGVRKKKSEETEFFENLINAMHNLHSNMRMFKSDHDLLRKDLLESHQRIANLEWEIHALKVSFGLEEERQEMFLDAKEVEPFVVEKT